MTSRTSRATFPRLVATLAAAVLICTGVGGCGSDDPEVSASEDAFMGAVMASTQSSDVRIEGTKITASYDSGSIKDSLARAHCATSSSILEAGQELFLHYPDGTVSCAELLTATPSAG